jgi:hypothetical protein
MSETKNAAGHAMLDNKLKIEISMDDTHTLEDHNYFDGKKASSPSEEIPVAGQGTQGS